METRKQWWLSGTEGKEECRRTTNSAAVFEGMMNMFWNS